MNDNTHISDSGVKRDSITSTQRDVLLKPQVSKAQMLTSCLFTRAPSKLKVVTAILCFFHFIYILMHTLSTGY